MKKIWKIVIVVLVALIALLVLAYFVTGEEWWEDPNQFGNWRQSINIVYEDSSSEPLTVSGLFPLSFYYDERGFVGMDYYLNARATGEDYSQIEIDYSSYEVRFSMASYEHIEKFVGSPLITILVDDSWYEVLTFYINMSDFIPPGIQPGTYDLSITPQGIIEYNPDNTFWYEAILPSPITIEIVVPGDGLVFTVGHTIDIAYTTTIFRPVSMGDNVGSATNWNSYPSSLENWECVDENVSDDDSTYIWWKEAPEDAIDLYQLENSTTEYQTIDKVTLFYRIRVIENNVVRFIPRIKTNGNVYSGTITWQSQAWSLRSTEWTENPATSDAWTWNEVNNLQAGLQVDNYIQGTDSRCTQVYVIVKYQV